MALSLAHSWLSFGRAIALIVILAIMIATTDARSWAKATLAGEDRTTGLEKQLGRSKPPFQTAERIRPSTHTVGLDFGLYARHTRSTYAAGGSTARLDSTRRSVSFALIVNTVKTNGATTTDLHSGHRDRVSRSNDCRGYPGVSWCSFASLLISAKGGE